VKWKDLEGTDFSLLKRLSLNLIRRDETLRKTIGKMNEAQAKVLVEPLPNTRLGPYRYGHKLGMFYL
jgi:hypothetical protein